MANEAGDMKTLGNFSKLIELVSVNADYNPANQALTVASLNAKKTAGYAAVSDVGAKQSPSKAAINDRQVEFEDLRPVVTRAGNVLRASTADECKPQAQE
ncbi:MAG TPA: hypothetical protein VNG71_04135 [Pyrinomonadaceae bacterium]|nr:hypothetical protein [Pyrinomonadaceae bacterium]